jgi:thymidylate synthase (FAD)
VSDRVQLLDHGFLETIESWGSDERIVEAARMSTGKGFLGWGPTPCDCVGKLLFMECLRCRGTQQLSGDEKLLRFLYEHHHNTPFEMAGLVIEVQAPIFVFREWHRHRTQSYNEMSARYVPLPDVNYIPSVERLLINSKTNKQAGTVAGAAVLTEQGAEGYREWLATSYQDAQALYEAALAMGVPKELARIHLPVGRYSRMRACANLRNWLAFLTLRMDTAAQYEIRVYANAVADIIARLFPRTYALFSEGRA